MQIAASVLENFYNVVIDNVRQKWIQQQPVNSFTITWENSKALFGGLSLPVRSYFFFSENGKADPEMC